MNSPRISHHDRMRTSAPMLWASDCGKSSNAILLYNNLASRESKGSSRKGTAMLAAIIIVAAVAYAAIEVAGTFNAYARYIQTEGAATETKPVA